MDHEAIQARREAYRKRFAEVLKYALDNPTDADYAARSGPFKLAFVVYDGPGIMLFDGDGKPMLQDPLRDPEDAVVILNSLNRMTAAEHEHVWRTDGMHQNEFCGICFVSKPTSASQ